MKICIFIVFLVNICASQTTWAIDDRSTPFNGRQYILSGAAGLNTTEEYGIGFTYMNNKVYVTFVGIPSSYCKDKKISIAWKENDSMMNIVLPTAQTDVWAIDLVSENSSSGIKEVVKIMTEKATDNVVWFRFKNDCIVEDKEITLEEFNENLIKFKTELPDSIIKKYLE